MVEFFEQNLGIGILHLTGHSLYQSWAPYSFLLHHEGSEQIGDDGALAKKCLWAANH